MGVDLRYFAARNLLGIATSEELVAAADRALCEGIYGEVLAELASTSPRSGEPCGAMYAKAMAEIGVAVPGDVDEAARHRSRPRPLLETARSGSVWE
ncbi:MAG: hypothetical protein R3F34_17330 [Planctomycetota bacterium]